ncbi:heme-binding protein 2 [Latimeria chalumnae]|uniref:heme-binding protein 2 n=1 Tax=Latimeria chalumnae TaxID=7897 RepID=UPI00313B7D96
MAQECISNDSSIFRRLIGLTLLSFLAVTGARKRSSGPSICAEVECFEFDEVCNSTDFEVRHYNTSMWVSTESRAYIMEMAAFEGLHRLYSYIQGENAYGVIIDMTAPVLVKVPRYKGFLEAATYTFSLLLPAEYQQSAPEPTNPNVFLSELPEMHVYVKPFSGWILTMTSKPYAKSLARDLNDIGASFNNAFYYNAAYNSPMALLNAHSEVWFIANGNPMCPIPSK